MRTTVLDIANGRLRDIRRDDSGAALVITLGVFMFLVMVTGGVYAIGENVRQKIELQNAVDAAAYSAANVQADILSRMATVNRAMSWTYVQMCNRQMDYIVAKWLDFTVKQFKNDKKRCKDYYDHIIILPTGKSCCNGCCYSTHKDANGYGWWCGAPGPLPDVPTSVTADAVRLNKSLMSTDISMIEGVLNAANPDMLAQGIDNDRSAIQAMNKLLASLNDSMPGAIEQTAVETLRQNLRLRGVTSEGGDVLNDYHFHVRIPKSTNPYDKKKGCFFYPLYNTEEHEQLFLAMADGSPDTQGKYQKNLLGYFGLDDVSNGLDHWYIRGHLDEFSADKEKVTRNETIPSPGYGITRGYKNANFREGGDQLRVPYWAQMSLLCNPASCQNYRGTKDNYTDLCKKAYENPEESVALCAEYVWASQKWFCISVPILQYCFHIPTPIVAMFSTDCSGHEGFTNWFPFSLSDSKRSKYKQCVLGLNFLINSGDPKKYILLTGNSRIYGDDKAIYDPKYYVTETCKPWILSPEFFKGDGTIMVFAARKMHNPLTKIFTGGSSGSISKGIFTAFNPVKDQYIWTVAASRAGYHRSGGSDRDYEVAYNGVTHVWHPDDDSSVFGVNSKTVGQGCICGKTEPLKSIWNLCTPDWEGTLLPVRYAAGYESPFNGTPSEDDFEWQECAAETYKLFGMAGDAKWGSLAHEGTLQTDPNTVRGSGIMNSALPNGKKLNVSGLQGAKIN